MVFIFTLFAYFAVHPNSGFWFTPELDAGG
jgi:hypothetical protein